ncbi:hypothetical protein VKT23_019251 [Stygiomarasmius scandens]|uniref:Uncharacterized protein n=1 Tax=Marasmiellus scandens TaxID=2682957 RepID=A0ABR1IPT5_9AGAR
MDPAPITVLPDTCPFLVVQYAVENHSRRSEHWALAVLELSQPPVLATFTPKRPPANRATVHLYQLTGTTDTFEFSYASLPYIEFIREPTLCGGCLVGFIPAPCYSNVTWLKTNLRFGVRIYRGDPGWDCQDWVLDCIRWLKPGWVENATGEESIREELVREKQRWEDVADVVYERLINSSLE